MLSRTHGTWFPSEPRKKSPATPSGIDPGTARLVAQYLNHYATPGPSSLFTPGKTQYPLYGKLGGPQGWSGRVRKISPAMRFSPQNARPVASRYTDYTLCNFSHTFHLLYVITNVKCTPKLGLRWLSPDCTGLTFVHSSCFSSFRPE
jgi:hypothetical protein